MKPETGHVGNDEMPSQASLQITPSELVDKTHASAGGHQNYNGIDTHALPLGADEAYEKKIAIMNEALIDIGMGRFQWMVFATTGFGWFVDNFWMQAITIITPPIQREFQVERIAFLTVAKYAGLVVGATAWPMTADFIGRRSAFNITLMISSVSGLVGAGSPNFVAISTFCAFIGLGTGGNQPVDSAIFLEFIPATHQYLLMMQSAFWSVGQAVAALIAWPLLANFSCESASTSVAPCRYENNMGWRYTYWAFGGLTMTLFLLRFIFKIYETPKYLLGKGLDQQAVDVVTKIAARNKTSTWLTVTHFEEVDARLADTQLVAAPNSQAGQLIKQKAEKFTPGKLQVLFSTPRLAFSTSMLIFIWCAIGMAFPLYNSFIPIYLENKSVMYGTSSVNKTYRNYAIQAVCSIPASILGGFTVEMKRVGRKGTGTLACLCTGVFLFLFTRASNEASVLGFTCAIAFTQNLVYGLLYSYTPELFPAPIRGTGNGLVSMCNRLSGLMAPIITAYVGLETDLPIWISAALFMVAGLVFLTLPFETRGRAAS